MKVFPVGLAILKERMKNDRIAKSVYRGEYVGWIV